jgi:hypothetical protein
LEYLELPHKLNIFLTFFLLNQKEAKNQAKSPNPFFFAQRTFAMPPEKLGFRTDLAIPTAPLPTYVLF